MRAESALQFLLKELTMSDVIPAGFIRPFFYDGLCYIYDGNNNMAAWFHPKLQARGWGRICLETE